jgi:hypothetical protein
LKNGRRACSSNRNVRRRRGGSLLLIRVSQRSFLNAAKAPLNAKQTTLSFGAKKSESKDT